LTKKVFSRGRVDIFIRESGNGLKNPVRIDEDQLKKYVQLIKKISGASKNAEPVRIESLLTLPQVIILEEEQIDLKEALVQLKKNLEVVFQKVEIMREKEGNALKKEFGKNLDLLSKLMDKFEEQIPALLKDYQDRLKQRIQKMTEQQSVDEWRLAQEVAYFVDRTDVSEEIQRFKNHILTFKDVLKEKGPVGRKLEFILQEMNREMNTLGSKSQSSSISQSVVSGKHELEKMREQVQNIE
ncbi:MAG: YicC family protein, partial [Deltaproteobacteria bacterium]|nr:YicC family protein [Deltaproteobacteria bacterium]